MDEKNESPGSVIHGGVVDAMKQVHEMSCSIKQGKGTPEKKIACVCGRTESSGCFNPRCDFPGWHG